MFTIHELRLHFLRLFPEFRELERRATTDPLTGLLNRRGFEEVLLREFALLARHFPTPPRDISERRPQPVMSFMVIDIDHFKQINDTHGHPAGDEVLTVLAKRIGEYFTRRSSDIVARCGGEEFWIGWPNVGVEAASAKARKFCSKLAADPINIRDTGGKIVEIPVTVSIGLSTMSVTSRLVMSEAFPTLNQQADVALLIAKRTGRNQALHATDLFRGLSGCDLGG